MEKPIVRAVDVGYGRVKFIKGRLPSGGYACESFPSVVGFAQSRSLGGGYFAERSTVTVAYKGAEYEVGPDALLSTGASSTRNLDMNYVRSDDYQILLRGALKMMGLPRIDVLVLGAPVANYEEAKEHLRSAFTGRIAVDRSFEVRVESVLVLPQPLGGYAWHGRASGTYDRIRRELNLLIDPGYFTLDWLVALGTKIVPGRSGSHPAGMSSLVRLLASEVARASGGGMDSLFLWDAIDRHFSTGEPLRLMGRPYDLGRHSGAIERLLASAAEAIAARVGDARDIQNVILVGGPAKLYEPAIRKALPGHAIQVAEEPVFANVRGFQLVGEELASRV